MSNGNGGAVTSARTAATRCRCVSPDVADSKLTAQQMIALAELLATGDTASAAKRANTSRRSVQRWCATHPAFRSALADAQVAVMQNVALEVGMMLADAVTALRARLKSTNDSTAFRAVELAFLHAEELLGTCGLDERIARLERSTRGEHTSKAG